MSGDVEQQILAELVGQREILERIETRLDSLETDVRIMRSQFLSNGKAIGAIEEKCRERGRLLAELAERKPTPTPTPGSVPLRGSEG